MQISKSNSKKKREKEGEREKFDAKKEVTKKVINNLQ